MAEQRERSRAGADAPSSRAARVRDARPPETEFVGFEKTEVLTADPRARRPRRRHLPGEARALAVLSGGRRPGLRPRLDRERGDRRPRRARRGDRVGDDQVLTLRGEGFAVGDRVKASVPWSVRFPTMANHTATHLLHKALRDCSESTSPGGLGGSAGQAPLRLQARQALTTEEREQVERAVNEKVFQNLPVRTFVTPIEEARKLGAMMLFGEKYGDEVRVVEVDGYSRELCGGTHVRSTAEIGPFVILSEGSVGSGVRRIEAITAGEAWAALRARSEELEELSGELERARKELAKGAEGQAGSEVVIRDESNGIVVAEVEAREGLGAQGPVRSAAPVEEGRRCPARLGRRRARLPGREPRPVAGREGARRRAGGAQGGGEDRRRRRRPADARRGRRARIRRGSLRRTRSRGTRSRPLREGARPRLRVGPDRRRRLRPHRDARQAARIRGAGLHRGRA